MPSKSRKNPSTPKSPPVLDAVPKGRPTLEGLCYPITRERIMLGGSGRPPLPGTYSPSTPYGADEAFGARRPVKLIAWCPPDADPHLTGVMVPQGSVVTQSLWWDALADRVTELVLGDPDPEEAAKWACRALRVPGVENPNQAGQSLVEGNLDLLENLYLSMAAYEDPFPASASEESEEVREAMAETDLELWINLAEPQMR
jgi:hypothetical protein